MVQKIEFFQVSLSISVRNRFLSKALSMSEMNVYQILRLNYYKKQKEWWTDDVDGDCISLNLYRNTESSIIFLKRWRGDFRKEEYCHIYQQGFYLEELTQIEWSISILGWLGSFINIVWFWSTKYFKICEYFILIGYYHKYYLWRNPWYLQTISKLLKNTWETELSVDWLAYT